MQPHFISLAVQRYEKNLKESVVFHFFLYLCTENIIFLTVGITSPARNRMAKDSSELNDYRREVKQRVLEYAMQEFLSRGIRDVKMDTIARSLSVSKRTLYELYSNKEELLLACMHYHHQKSEEHLVEIASKKNMNVVDILVELYNYQTRFMTSFNSAFVADIQKFDRVREYLVNEQERRNERSVEFIKRGIEEGLFRSDVNFELALVISQSVARTLIQDGMLDKYPFNVLFRNVLLFFLRGICTSNGLELIEKYFSSAQSSIE